MSKTNQMIITDNIDLSQKKIFTKDEFYKDNKSLKNFSLKDFRSIDSAKIEKNSEIVYYALVSTSDKVINNRNYDYESWLDTVKAKKWLKPYKKPILYNHDLYFSSPQGRIENAFFIKHEGKQILASSIEEELPTEVIDYYDSIGAFSVGTGSVITKFTADEWLAERINNELDLTVSQSSFMNKAVCNICGKDFFGSECCHYPGEEYEIEENGKKVKKVCVVNTFDFEPIELSFVNLPANDTSVVYVYKTEKEGNKADDSLVNTDKKDGVENQEDKNNNETNKNINKDNNEKEGGVSEPVNDFKDILKNQISDKFNLSEDKKELFGKLFDTMDSNQIKDFISFLEEINKKEEVVTNDSKEEESLTEDSKEGKTPKDNKGQTEEKTNEPNENKENKEEGSVEDNKNEKENKFSDNGPASKFFNKDGSTIKKAKINNELQAIVNACIEEE